MFSSICSGVCTEADAGTPSAAHCRHHRRIMESRHLDMALQAQVRAADEGLVGAVGALQDAGGAGRDREGLAVPVEGLEACGIAQPIRAAASGVASTAPADLLDRVSAVTVPPKALAMSCPPRQWPITGIPAVSAARISCSVV
jgi:hypothetical protein